MQILSNLNFFEYLKQQFQHAFGRGIGDAVREALEPEAVDFFGIAVNPSFFTAIFVSIILIVFAAAVRIFVIPRFKKMPSGLQLALESFVSYFDKTTHDAVHRHSGFIGPYVLTASVFIALSTLIELVGLRPAFASINTCFAFGLMTFIMIQISGVRQNRFGGHIKERYGGLIKAINVVTDLSIPISMSFRLFGSIMSGFIVMELLYSMVFTSIALPAALSVITTFFHAFIQAYLFTILTNVFVGEVVELRHTDLAKT